MKFAYIDTSVLTAIAFDEPDAEECASRLDKFTHLGACAVGIHGCKSALIHAPGRSISLHIHQYSPQSISQGRGDSEFSLSRIPTAQAPSLVKSARS